MTIDAESLMPEIEPTETPPELPEANLNTEAPADKEPQSRGKDGKFASDKPKEKEPEAKKEEKPEHTVPVRTLVEERKAWAAERKALEERLAKLENPPKAPDPEPDYAQDPKGYTDHRVKAALAELEGTKKQVEEVKQTAQQSAEQVAQQRFHADLATAEAAFVAQQPDYYDALAHIRNIRASQLQMFHPEITQQQIAETIGREELQLAMQLARANRNPIATAYEMAKQYGYQPKAKDAPKVELPNVPGPKTLPPDQTLGTGAARSETQPEDQEARDPFSEAFNELYGKRRRA